MNAAYLSITDYFTRIVDYRYFWMSLVRMDLRTRYRRSLIGIGWTLVNPIATTTVLCFVFQNIFGEKNVLSFASYLLSGLCFWQFVLAGFLQGCFSILSAQSYVCQEPAPMAIYPLRVSLSAMFHFLVSFTVCMIFTWAIVGPRAIPIRKDQLPKANAVATNPADAKGTATANAAQTPAAPANAVDVKLAMVKSATAQDAGVIHTSPILALISIIPTMILLFTFVWSVAILTGISQIYFHDSQHLLEVALQIAMYASAIITPASIFTDHDMGWLIDYNPFAILVSLVRYPILYQLPPDLLSYVKAIIVVGSVAALAMLAISRNEKRLVFHF